MSSYPGKVSATGNLSQFWPWSLVQKHVSARVTRTESTSEIFELQDRTDLIFVGGDPILVENWGRWLVETAYHAIDGYNW